ncbi:MAG TPA: hypothetical protein VMT52_16710 [Planctomycetota bacterium]|nr:hypothetical protein [Planctomycetota bacterium]
MTFLAQCAMCGESLRSGTGGGDPAYGFSVGVLVMLGVVLLVAGGFVTLVVVAARGEDEASGPGA